MIQCPKCSAENPPDSRFCNSCGQELSSVSQMPTMEAPEQESPPAPAQSPHVGRIVSSDSVPAGGFTPGTILADRYRVIGLLGRGGMGEVYRADDLKLGQPVALKFLPPALAEDSVRRERFFAEVRITRQLSHPNICRVYDIGEIDGRHFLSMEYIDGEDLASLMKRIGHLSNEKALDIARQLVAGLTVAHERGVLHRDLKPANIMLDGHGRVRITDFGLAIAAEDESQAEEIAGTPAYMAPEQLAGKGATVRSDIYSLGLILYEIYTGKKAFKANTLAELREQKETQTPRAPSELRQGIDPVVERVIQRCMEKDPNARPASVVQLAQALPGGDPLVAAIAAGETPSPEMVAESGSHEGLRPVVAWGLLVFIIVGTLAFLTMNDRFQLHRRIPFEKPPEALADRAQEFLKKVGYSEEFADSAHGFMYNNNLLGDIENKDKTPDRWENLDSKAILFWYRQSPVPLQALLMDHSGGSSVSPNNPPLLVSGEILVILDAEGRLLLLRVVPPQMRPSNGSAPEPDWEILFDEAGLEFSEWTLTDAQRNPPSYADKLAAWQGSLPNYPGALVTIEAAALQGQPISFEIIGEWVDQTEQKELFQLRPDAYDFINLLIFLGGVYFALRNIRHGRGDRRNATRLALFAYGAMMVHLILGLPPMSYSYFYTLPILAGTIWIFYMAIEPFVRRRWPKILISWTRLLSGKGRDQLVARDVLIGCAFGVLLACMGYFALYLIPSWLGLAKVSTFTLNTILGPSPFAAQFFALLWISISHGLTQVCVLFLLRVFLKNQNAAFVAFILIAALFASLGNIWFLPYYMIRHALMLFVLMRFGLVSFLLSIFIFRFLAAFPFSLEASTLVSGYSFTALAILAAIVLYAFRASLGGRPLFGTPRIDE